MNYRLATLFLASTTLLLAACTGSGDATPEPTTTASPTATTTATPTSSTTSSPEDSTELPPGLTTSPPGTWQQLELHAGDEVPDAFGAFIADATTGVGTLWSLDPAATRDPDYVFISTTPNADFVIARGQPEHLVNTSTGDSFTWTFQERFRQIDDRGYALFTAPRGCAFWLVDLSGTEPQPVAAHDLPADEGSCAIEARLSPDATELLVAVGYATILRIDLATGTTDELATVDANNISLADSPDDGVAAHFTASLPGSAWIARYDWATRTLTTTSIETGALTRGDDKNPPQPGHVRISSDGRWAAWTSSDDLGTGQGMGGTAEWPVVVIASIENATPVVRAQRLAFSSGIGAFRWLHNSTAIVVQSEGGFALLSPDGTLDELPFHVASHFDPVPIPSPDATDRFLYNGRVIDDAGNELGGTAAVVETWGGGPDPRWGLENRYAWGATSDRLVFTHTAVPGGDFGRGGIATLGLPPRTTTGHAAATPDEPIRLRVASDGDNLNVRAAPGLAAERIGKLPHGTLVTISRDTSIEHCGERGCSILNDPDPDSDNPWWIYVSDEDGLDGWITSQFVEWAD